MTIDVWAQITTERMASRPWMQTLLRWTGSAAGQLPTTESTLAAMDEADVLVMSAAVADYRSHRQNHAGRHPAM